MNQAAAAQQDGLRSIRLELENFKNIDKKIIEIGGRSLIIMGKNNTGKSSIIQAMKAPMDAKVLPTKPVKDGEEKALISHTIAGNIDGVYHEYKMDIHFNSKTQKGRLVVYNEQGEEQKSPATLLKSIIGATSFDITKWMYDSKDKKLKTLKALTGCEVQIDILNRDIDTLKVSLKVKDDRADSLEGALKEHEFKPEEIELYSNAVDITAIQQEMNAIGAKQAAWDKVNSQMAGFQNDVKNCHDKINSAAARINELQQEIKRQQGVIEEQTKLADVANGNLAKGNEWLGRNQRPTIDEVNNRLTQAMSHNEKNQRIIMLNTQHKEMIDLRHESQNIKKQIKAKEAEITDVISKSQLPIKNMTFTNDEIYIDGLPFEDEQINTATRFDVCVEVAIALNPRYKTIFLDDASLYDKEHLKSIVGIIESKGYVVIAEVVSEDDTVEARFTETVF